MYSKTKLALLCLILVFVSITVVSAGDVNSTSLATNHADDSIAVANDDLKLDNAKDVKAISSCDNSNNNDILNAKSSSTALKDVKKNTTITPASTKIVKGNYLQVYLKDSNNKAVKNVTVTFKIDNKNYNVVTDSKGVASLKITKNVGTYKVTASFKGNKDYAGT